jgi:hypothetical protein
LLPVNINLGGEPSTRETAAITMVFGCSTAFAAVFFEKEKARPDGIAAQVPAGEGNCFQHSGESGGLIAQGKACGARSETPRRSTPSGWETAMNEADYLRQQAGNAGSWPVIPSTLPQPKVSGSWRMNLNREPAEQTMACSRVPRRPGVRNSLSPRRMEATHLEPDSPSARRCS